jgi:hypothetical protein
MSIVKAKWVIYHEDDTLNNRSNFTFYKMAYCARQRNSGLIEECYQVVGKPE